MDYGKVDVRDKIIRVAKSSDRHIVAFKDQNYEKLKSECLRSGTLFEDPVFTASNRSMFYTQPVPSGTRWKRPWEITNKPQFITDHVSAGDLDQGYLGNCWFIAACASITLEPEVFDNVVPKDQTFDKSQYAGIFHFHFWYYGQWVDVVVDDRLPVYADNKLIFCSNKQEPSEFWAALCEKAYAKLCGNYENLDGGNTTDALIDMTGGIQESFEIKEMRNESSRNEIWQILCKSRQHKSLIGASIAPNPRIREARLTNGLVMGHAYTITRVAEIEIRSRVVRLIRVRNPWGNDVEWRGAWSDKASDWYSVTEQDKQALGYKNLPDGEFWMNYDDFYRNYETIQLCDLTPDAFSSELLKKQENKGPSKLTWKLTAYNGEWIPGKSSGGSGADNAASFWQNPQFLLTLTDVDPDDNENMATVIVSLLQKYTREKRTQNSGESCEEFIQFRLYQILNDRDAQEAKRTGLRLYASQLERVSTSGSYINLREVTKRFRMAPGNYLIIPSCYDRDVRGEFLLRVYTENPINETNASVLTDHKDKLDEDDIFFNNPKSLDEEFSTWANLLGPNDKSKQSSYSSTTFSKMSPSVHKKPCLKEFKVYMDNGVLNVYDKVDVRKNIRRLV